MKNTFLYQFLGDLKFLPFEWREPLITKIHLFRLNHRIYLNLKIHKNKLQFKATFKSITIRFFFLENDFNQIVIIISYSTYSYLWSIYYNKYDDGNIFQILLGYNKI